MRIAYIVSAYRNPRQLVRLVRRLEAAGSAFFIHVDRRADAAVWEPLVRRLGGHPAVRFLPRHRCRWGDFGHVAASLEGIRAFCKADLAFDYAVLLTGQCYPIKPAEHIAAFLDGSRGVSYLDSFPLPSENWPFDGMDRIQAWHVCAFGRHFEVPLRPEKRRGLRSLERSPLWGWLGRALPTRRVPGGLHPHGGSSYWCLSAEAVRHVDRFVAANPAFVRFFRYVRVPDELFFQTILMNSPLQDRIVNDNCHYIDWSAGGRSPRTLGAGDLPRLTASAKLFARKFDDTLDSAVLDLIDAELLGGAGVRA